MTALPFAQHEADSLGPGAQPATIARYLFPSDREEFVRAFKRDLAHAHANLDLAPLFQTLEQWRGRAILQSSPEQYREDLRRAAEIVTGEPSPEDEPLETTLAKVGG